MNNKHLFLFLFSYALLFTLLFPFYQYAIDSDATAYFSVAEKVAAGNYSGSVNAIWSPLGSWLVAPFIHWGFNEIVVAKVLNGIYGCISLCFYFFLIRRMKMHPLANLLVLTGAMLLVLHFAFTRLFADLLQAVFLLWYLNVTCKKDFGERYRQVIAAALIGGIAFYAKAYTFYFTLFHLPLVIMLFEKRARGQYLSINCFKKIASAVVVLLVVVSCWIVAVNIKYGHYIPGEKNVTGTLSQSYTPVKEVAYPPQPGNYSVLDDISNVSTVNITPFTNEKFFAAQVKIFFANCIELIKVFNAFSVLSLAVIFGGAYSVIRKNSKVDDKAHITVLLCFLLVWSFGLLLLSVQPRFFWIIDLIILAMAGQLVSLLLRHNKLKKSVLYCICCIGLASFYLYPITMLLQEAGKNKAFFEIAAVFKVNNIKGRIMANKRSNDDVSNSIVINFLNRSRYYGTYLSNSTDEQVLRAIKEQKINYFWCYYSTVLEKNVFLSSQLCLKGSKIYSDIYPGIVVVKFNE